MCWTSHSVSFIKFKNFEECWPCMKLQDTIWITMYQEINEFPLHFLLIYCIPFFHYSHLYLYQLHTISGHSFLLTLKFLYISYKTTFLYKFYTYTEIIFWPVLLKLSFTNAKYSDIFCHNLLKNFWFIAFRKSCV